MLRPLRRIRVWPLAQSALIVLIGATIIHIGWTMAMPLVFRNNTVLEMMRALQPNTAMVLPPARQGTQTLPFLSADRRYGVCHYDVREGVVHLQARLTGLGWGLALFGSDAQNYYYLGGEGVRQTTVAILLLPSGDRNVGALARARRIYPNTPEIVAATQEGLVVLMAPDDGAILAPRLDADMAEFRCTLVRSGDQTSR